MAEYLKTQKGKTKLAYKGYCYVKDRNLKNGAASWICDLRYQYSCKGRIRMAADGHIEITTDHSHAPDAARKKALQFSQAIKERAGTTHETTQHVIAECLSNINVSEAEAARLPAVSSLKKTIRRERNRQPAIDPQPATLLELNFRPEHLVLDDGTEFLLYDSGPALDRFLIFSTRENLAMLCRSDHWQVDGTFKVTPHPFYQLFTIHANVFEGSYPLVYALMPGKMQENYRSLLQALTTLQPGLNPSTLMVDFEKASINAFKLQFPNLEITGCFFHLAQCIWRQVQRHGLVTIYENEPDFASQIKCLAAIAFLRVADVEEAFTQMTTHESWDERGNPVADYFEDNYIGRPNRRGPRRRPLFDHDLWNVHQRALDNSQRTNNIVEAWHRGFQTLVGPQCPNIFRFLALLQKDYSVQKLKIQQAAAGRSPPRKRQRFEQSDNRISRILHQYEDRTLLEKLRSISHAFEF